jgi:hypothetical protein
VRPGSDQGEDRQGESDAEAETCVDQNDGCGHCFFPLGRYACRLLMGRIMIDNGSKKFSSAAHRKRQVADEGVNRSEMPL